MKYVDHVWFSKGCRCSVYVNCQSDSPRGRCNEQHDVGYREDRGVFALFSDLNARVVLFIQANIVPLLPDSTHTHTHTRRADHKKTIYSFRRRPLRPAIGIVQPRSHRRVSLFQPTLLPPTLKLWWCVASIDCGTRRVSHSFFRVN